MVLLSSKLRKRNRWFLVYPINYNSKTIDFIFDFKFALYSFHSPLLRISLFIPNHPVNLSILFTGGKKSKEIFLVTASEKNEAQNWNLGGYKSSPNCSLWGSRGIPKDWIQFCWKAGPWRVKVSLDPHSLGKYSSSRVLRVAFLGTGMWKLDVGGKWLLTLNITVRPIANKYCEGKLK